MNLKIRNYVMNNCYSCKHLTTGYDIDTVKCSIVCKDQFKNVVDFTVQDVATCKMNNFYKARTYAYDRFTYT